MFLVAVKRTPEPPLRTIAAKWVAELTPTLRLLVSDTTTFTNNLLKASKDQVNAGLIDVSYIDKTVEYLLRAKFSLGLFESKSYSLCYDLLILTSI